MTNIIKKVKNISEFFKPIKIDNLFIKYITLLRIMSVQSEVDKIMALHSHGKISTYSFQSNNKVSEIIECLVSQTNNVPLAGITNCKNFKMEYYYPVFEFIINYMNKVYFDNTNKNVNNFINFDLIIKKNILLKLTTLYKGQILLQKISHRIDNFDTQDKHLISYLYLLEAARAGTFMTFLFWLNRSKFKTVEKLPMHDQEEIFIKSIGNSDDRLFKFVLDKVLKFDKLFFQKNTSTIKNMIDTLSLSGVPPKYVLKRIKILSSYISLVPYFNQMIKGFTSSKIIVELHKHYYVNPHDFETIKNIIHIFVTPSWTDENNENILNIINYNMILSLLKSDEEKYIINIILTILYNMHNITVIKQSIIDKIVRDNYCNIIEIINWHNIKYDNALLNSIIYSLTNQNLINKYVDSHAFRNLDLRIIFYTRFLKIYNTTNHNSLSAEKTFKTSILINNFLHKLRLHVKTKCKKRVIQQKVKMFDLLREIKSFSPTKTIPVLKYGSIHYQFQKQKFTNLPPRLLLPGEISIYQTFLLKEKADGILINNLPIGIYPQVDIINNYQVKAEYIEELDLYLIFDIDIPNTTIEERYYILRNSHSYTKNISMQNIKSISDFIELMNFERINIKRFINENVSNQIKWYPKFSCKYMSTSNINIHKEFVQKIILEQDTAINDLIQNSEPFKCDGLILTPLDGGREIKIKPKSLMTIDLYFDGKKWTDRNKYDWSNIIVKTKTPIKDGRIYRCYPNKSFTKFTVGEFRYDKKKPNPFYIVDNIVTMIGYDWNQDINHMETFYYDSPKKITSQTLINTIKSQVDNLTTQITTLEPEINKSWLDLGCGRGKLIPIIKKYNPKHYLGLDVDVKQLIKGIQYHDENQDTYVFNPCNLSGNWENSSIKWHQINTNIKYDYIVANFALMHFCNDSFWSQLNEIVHPETKFIFNIVSPPDGIDNWSESESYLRIERDKTIYKFEWTHDEEKNEPYISEQQMNDIIKKYNWKVMNKQSINSKYQLINFYKWWIIKKN